MIADAAAPHGSGSMTSTISGGGVDRRRREREGVRDQRQRLVQAAAVVGVQREQRLPRLDALADLDQIGDARRRGRRRPSTRTRPAPSTRQARPIRSASTRGHVARRAAARRCCWMARLGQLRRVVEPRRRRPAGDHRPEALAAPRRRRGAPRSVAARRFALSARARQQQHVRAQLQRHGHQVRRPVAPQRLDRLHDFHALPAARPSGWFMSVSTARHAACPCARRSRPSCAPARAPASGVFMNAPRAPLHVQHQRVGALRPASWT